MVRLSIGINIAPPAPRIGVVIPAQPASDYFWIDGYWYPFEGRYIWHDGYWTRPPYLGAHWYAPRYDGRLFYHGYWGGDGGRVEHDHHWDNERGRDYHHEGHGEGHGHGRH